MEFKLKSFLPVIRIANFKGRANGRFHAGRNGFGLLNEIALNQKILNKCDYWEILGVLLHELLHSEQYNTANQSEGTYHNRKFCDRAKEIGLLVDSKGFQKYAPAPTLFINLLRAFQVDIPDKSIGILPLSGESKLQPWICACQPRPVHIQVAIKNLKARCLKCNQLFVPKEQFRHNGNVFSYSQNNINKRTQSAPGLHISVPKVTRNNIFTKE